MIAALIPGLNGSYLASSHGEQVKRAHELLRGRGQNTGMKVDHCYIGNDLNFRMGSVE